MENSRFFRLPGSLGKTIAWSLLFIGLILVIGGLFAQSSLTPLATMDCGCGGAQACVTKQSMVSLGSLLTASGLLCFFLSSTSLIWMALVRPRLA